MRSTVGILRLLAGEDVKSALYRIAAANPKAGALQAKRPDSSNVSRGLRGKRP
jgi:hypothetical protein